jgi:SNF2 family DNA or RNA helicase
MTLLSTNIVTEQLPAMAHQVQAAQLCAKYPRYGHWLDCGTGKTIAMLLMLHASKIARHVRPIADGRSIHVEVNTVSGVKELEAAPYCKTLVVCPKAIMRNAWERDAKHYPNLNLTVCWGPTPNKRRALIATDNADILVINPECFKKHVADFIGAGVRRIIIDESSMMKNPDSQITKAAIAFADQMQSVYLLSGTPAPNSDIEYWPQMRAIDKRVFGDSWYRHEREYFIPINRDVSIGQDRVKKITVGWKPKPDTRERFVNRLNARSWSLRKAQCLDLPEQMDVVRTVDLSSDEATAYSNAEQELRTHHETEGTTNIKTEALTNKLRQLCGGWMYGPMGSKAESIRFGNAKMNALNDLLDELGKAPAIVWVDFREDARAIGELLESRGETYRTLTGNGDESTEAVSSFQDGDVHRLICHPASVGHGVTLTAANYAIFYTLPWSYELYQQARDRIHRKGQRNVCTYFHLMVEDSIDQVTYWTVKRKKKASDGMMKLLSQINSKDATNG